jgi:hypothetical protein
MGRVSEAIRFISIMCSCETLSELTLLPRDTYTKAYEGESAVERPSVPWLVEVFDDQARDGHFLAEGYSHPTRKGVYPGGACHAVARQEQGEVRAPQLPPPLLRPPLVEVPRQQVPRSRPRRHGTLRDHGWGGSKQPPT